ncbi:MAG: peptidoglycan bridge formation glycyltransferase FemA/FemB family protein [Chloroflexi bacterium]|nr:peptidoglycan bridge formation glycyltransferase FemA/FemB family protein [Chloroflexota bacterium]
MRHELERDPALWDAFVAASADPSYLQVTAWAAIKAPDGWVSLRVAVGGAHGPIGGQVLVQRPRPSPWGMGYMPRGPVSTGSLTPSDVPAFTERLRKVARMKRLTYVRIEPEVEAGAGVEDALRSAGWVAAPHVQPETTRIVDMSVPKAEVWAGLQRKARQSVNKSERQGVRVVDADASR